jgi:histone-lysine N-methyltransferase SETMAR
MPTVFFSGFGAFFVNSLPEGHKMNSACYAHEILHPRSVVSYPNGPEMARRQATVPFDKTSIDSATEVRECLDGCGLSRMEHPPYSPDLTPCHCFLFEYVKEKFGSHRLLEFDDLFQAVDEILRDILRETFDGVFEDWIRRLGECRKRRGNTCITH